MLLVLPYFKMAFPTELLLANQVVVVFILCKRNGLTWHDFPHRYFDV